MDGYLRLMDISTKLFLMGNHGVTAENFVKTWVVISLHMEFKTFTLESKFIITEKCENFKNHVPPQIYDWPKIAPHFYINRHSVENN